MIKIQNLISKPSLLSECVIATVHLNGETILIKNRDRAYDPTISIVHELVNDVEIMYIHDELTDWSEGMNEYGIGIINSSLMVNFDEKEGEIAKDKDKSKKGSKPSYDGLKIRTALSKNKLSEAIKSIINFSGDDHKDVGVKGMTMVANPKHAFVIEMTSEHLPVIKKIDSPKVTVRTNHGVAYPDTGYTSGIKRESSITRLQVAKKELAKANDPEELLDIMSNQWMKNNFMNPYRRNNKLNMHSTGQVMMNLDELKFYFRWDVENSRYDGYVNKLPAGYKPKITLANIDEVQ